MYNFRASPVLWQVASLVVEDAIHRLFTLVTDLPSAGGILACFLVYNFRGLARPAAGRTPSCERCKSSLVHSRAWLVLRQVASLSVF